MAFCLQCSLVLSAGVFENALETTSDVLVWRFDRSQRQLERDFSTYLRGHESQVSIMCIILLFFVLNQGIYCMVTLIIGVRRETGIFRAADQFAALTDKRKAVFAYSMLKRAFSMKPTRCAYTPPPAFPSRRAHFPTADKDRMPGT